MVSLQYVGPSFNRRIFLSNPFLVGSDIINDNQFELELIVPSEWLNWLKSDNRFSFEVDETRTVLEAQIIRFGATVDPISQTVKLVGRFLAHPDGIKAGMSGSAHFKVPGG